MKPPALLVRAMVASWLLILSQTYLMAQGTVVVTLYLVQAVRLDTTADDDGDGLSTGFEIRRSGTEPSLADSDFDGRSDRAELLTRSDPLLAPLQAPTEIPLALINPFVLDTTDDEDGDHLSSGFEIRRSGTEPSLADSDFDGRSDRAELLARSDPLLPPLQAPTEVVVMVDNRLILDTSGDQDRDGLTDGFERWVSMTSANHFDTDGDGVGDGVEVRSGMDPLSLPKPVDSQDVELQIRMDGVDSILITIMGSGQPTLTIHESSDLESWSVVETVRIQSGSRFSIQRRIPQEHPARFIKVQRND